MPTITNIINTNNKEIDIQSQGGALNIATQPNATVLTLGNVSGATAVNVNTGTAGNTITTTNGVHTVITGSGVINIGQSGTTGAINIGNSSAGALAIESGAASTITIANNSLSVTTGTGAVNISADATANTVNIATGAGAKALVLGSTNTTSSVTINTGSGGLTIPSFSSYGVLVSDSSGVITDAATSTAGFILTSNGPSSAPTFQTNAGGAGIGTLNGDSGSATGPTVTIAGGSNITTSATSATLTVDLDSSPSVSGSITAGTGVIATTGGLTATAGGLTVTAGTVTISPFTTTGALVSDASGVVTDADASTAGYILTSNGPSSVPTFQVAPVSGIVTINGDSGSITGATITINGGTTGLTTTGSGTTMSLTGTLAVANGGTGVTAVTIAPTATAFAGWDSNENLSANAMIEVPDSVPSNVTLTVASSSLQIVTAASGIVNITMPVVSTLALGRQFKIVMPETGTVNVYLFASGGSTISFLNPRSGITTLTCISTSGITPASWTASSSLYTNLALYNTFAGANSGTSVSSGTYNTIYGVGSGPNISTGIGNTAVGAFSGRGGSTGNNNTVMGAATGSALNSTVEELVLIGSAAGQSLAATGTVAIGFASLKYNTSANPSTAIGWNAGTNIGSGGYHTMLGYNTGSSLGTTDASNIFIGHAVVGTGGDNNKLIIGVGTGTGAGQISSCQISGITGTALAATTADVVMVSSGNRLATHASTINLGTAASASTISVGNATGATSVAITSGSGQVTITSPTATLLSSGLATAPVDSNAATTAFGASLTAGSAVQNTTGYNLMVNISVAITAATTSTLVLGVGSGATPTTDTVVPSFTVAADTRFSFTAIVPKNYYLLVDQTGSPTIASITTQVCPL